MKIFIAIIALVGSASAFAVFGTLVSETVNGSLKYCKYSNGVVITIKSYEVCPVTNGYAF